MQEWIRQVLDVPAFGVLVLPAALLLGVLSVVATPCNVPLFAAVTGYAGSREDRRRSNVLLACACLMLGTILALSVLGALIGYLGYVAGGAAGLYGRLFIGFITIVFGLAALGLLPFRLPDFKPANTQQSGGLLGAAVFGSAVGAASITCTLACCGPLLPLILSLAAMRGQPGWGASILTSFAIGYSVPLAAVMLGVSFGRLSGVAMKVATPIRYAAGILLVGVGFWLLTGS